MIIGAPTFCNKCGIKLADLENEDIGTQLTSITSAARDFTQVNPDKNEKKHNQQKWGLFETNYQREKGITTEESLQEIEQFQAEGVLPTSAPKREATVGGDFRGNLDSVLIEAEEKKKNPSLVKRMSQKLGFGKSSTTDINEPRQVTAKNEFAEKFAEGGSNAGADFFSKYQQQQNAKFRPQNR